MWAAQAGDPRSQETWAHVHRKDGHLAGESGYLWQEREEREVDREVGVGECFG